MEEGTRRAIRDLAYYSGLGLSVALAVFIGLFFGIFLDTAFGTGPVLMFVFLGLGILAGFRNILHAMRRVQDTTKKDGYDERHD
jgi:ATP synthase protein I